MKNGIRFDISHDYKRMPGAFAFWLSEVDAAGDKKAFATSMTFKKDFAEGQLIEPVFHAKEADCVDLMNTLWTLGFRPTIPGAMGTQGQLEATVRHLQDMRQLVFKKELQPLEKIRL